MEVLISKARRTTARLNLMGRVEYGNNTVQYREILDSMTGQDTVAVAFLDTLAEQAGSACPTPIV